jgi:hypothetical protein
MYKHKIMTQSQIGRIFGTTSHEVGRWLVKVGLRTSQGKPTATAHKGGYCETAPSHNNGYYWAWNAEKTVAALEAAGHIRASLPPLDLVNPSPLSGPFQARLNEAGHTELVDSNGFVNVIVSGEQNAKLVISLLNLAHRHGKLATMKK